MDRRKALETLGIYEGTSKQRIEEKFSTLMDGASDQQVILLREAREMLLTDAPSLTDQRPVVVNSSDASRKSGPMIIIALVLGVLFFSAFAAGGLYWFDASTDPRKANSMLAEAEQLALDYEGYLEDSNTKANAKGKLAAALLVEGKNLKEAKEYQAASEKLLESRNAYVDAFSDEAQLVNELWNTQVVEAFNSKLKSKFPFTSDSEATAGIADVQAIFNPVDGYLHTISKRMTLLSIIKIEKQNLFQTPKNFQSSIGPGVRISEALFSTGTTNIEVTFEAELLPHNKKSELSVGFGDQLVRLADDKPNTYIIRLDGDEKSTVSFAGWSKERHGETARKPLLEFNSTWGLGGSLREFAILREVKGSLVVWELDLSKLSKNRSGFKERKETKMPQLHLTTNTDANPFNPEIYLAFRP